MFTGSLSQANLLHHSKGFTLIELMIVMGVVALLMGLVGPLTMQQLDKNESHAELLTLKREFSYLSKVAYITGQSFQINIDGKQLEIINLNNGKVESVKEYKQLFFDKKRVVINKSGFTNDIDIVVNFMSKKDVISLNDLINKPYTDAKK
ncbi:prepilin-type N-terminal cleavage/methylation domain-containing protein [Pseudoalteromonas tunicata]|jgi:prepilin-type N-terminal cleavage/methylation domain-containing protein|uniref:Prepilin-type N-terminal cleavage/methylation domain-containing protein n=1 Tax=Pseudoalteromonas tunicata D2 TaxID=87626 RepID=A4C8H1_9GAMM|nr:prepilin-type N-terminal cleavage/methylation domain-containing protein [Pseudoalteromonas tunicata]ATC93390.1 hypothetical protein PTUN_a0623 [Pseudoalteromonas tunicata]AXT32434.1 prepilin-type N-terminal cleavage/methylation domain-containing protein [Pseudoalteromonas tunicata]EAR28886.1 hypothetical protein PTD2_07579 [Pseudoalteromonas tunicata D2]